MVSSKSSSSNVNSAPHFFGGIAAGVAEWFVGHPLDTIRVRLIAGNIYNGGKPVAGTYQQLVTGFGSVQGWLIFLN